VDNYSVHASERVKAEQKAWEEADIHLFYLPSYRPELSEIEPVWQAVKYRELTQRSFHSLGDLLTQVKDALLRKSVQLLTTHQTAPYTDYFLRRAA
jgi:transposase